MPTVEQREQIIERVVQKTIKQVQLVSTTQNKIQGDFFEINELPVVNPKDIVLLRDMREYPLPYICLLYTSPSPRDATLSRMPSSA